MRKQGKCIRPNQTEIFSSRKKRADMGRIRAYNHLHSRQGLYQLSSIPVYTRLHYGFLATLAVKTFAVPPCPYSLVTTEREEHGVGRNRVSLYDNTVLPLSLDQLRQVRDAPGVKAWVPIRPRPLSLSPSCV